MRGIKDIERPFWRCFSKIKLFVRETDIAPIGTIGQKWSLKEKQKELKVTLTIF